MGNCDLLFTNYCNIPLISLYHLLSLLYHTACGVVSLLAQSAKIFREVLGSIVSALRFITT